MRRGYPYSFIVQLLTLSEVLEQARQLPCMLSLRYRYGSIGSHPIASNYLQILQTPVPGTRSRWITSLWHLLFNLVMKRKAYASTGSTETSENVRQKGNVMYNRLQRDLSPVIFQQRVQQAIDLYQQALDLATSDDDRASAWKNLASCHAKQLQQGSPAYVCTASYLVHASTGVALWHFLQALTTLSCRPLMQAYKRSKHSQQHACMEQASQTFGMLASNTRFPPISKLAGANHWTASDG